MSLEDVLKRIEALNPGATRDPELYHVSIFGDPGPGKTWGWRFEGHHLSLSFTIVDGLHISSTPSMMGTNPDIVPDGHHKGLQILADEENIARELAKSLSTNQKSEAIISAKAPADIVTGRAPFQCGECQYMSNTSDNSYAGETGCYRMARKFTRDGQRIYFRP